MPHQDHTRLSAQPEPVRKWLRFSTTEGALANVFITYTGGAFLTGMALMLGAGHFQIGLLAAIPFLAQIAQLWAASLIERFRNRKMVVFWLSVAGRQVWWLVLPIVLLTGRWRLHFLIMVVLFSNISVMIATPGWMSWMADIIPEKIRGRYFGVRNAVLAASAVVSVLLGGIVLDYSRSQNHEPIGFAVIVTLACVFAAAAAGLLRKIPDVAPIGKPPRLTRSGLTEPLRNAHFRRLLLVFLAWNMSIGIAAPFFAPHMLTNLKMSFTVISIYSTAGSLVAILFNKSFGGLIDKFGSKPVSALCAFGIGIIPLVWLFPRSDFLWILGFEAVYSGILWTGFNLAAFNIPIANSPKDRRIAYLGMFNMVTGLGFFAASLLGGWLAELWADVSWQVGRQTIVNYHLLFALSGLLRLSAAALLLTFHEPAEKRLPVMLQFMGYAVLKRLSVGRQLFPWPPR